MEKCHFLRYKTLQGCQQGYCVDHSMFRKFVPLFRKHFGTIGANSEHPVSIYCIFRGFIEKSWTSWRSRALQYPFLYPFLKFLKSSNKNENFLYLSFLLKMQCFSCADSGPKNELNALLCHVIYVRPRSQWGILFMWRGNESSKNRLFQKSSNFNIMM